MYRKNLTFIPSERCIYLKKRTRTSDDKMLIIRVFYILGIIIWTILICLLGLYNHDIICTCLLFVPYIVFIAGVFNSDKVTEETEGDFFSYNYLSVGLLIFLPLLTWLNSNNKNNDTIFITLVILALIFTMLSMIDIFISPEYLTVAKHIKSIFQTLSMILLIYAIYMYYISNY